MHLTPFYIAGVDTLIALAEPSLSEWVLMLLGRRRRVRVRGDSMLPLLRPGDLLLLDQRAYRQQPPQKDDIVVAWHPHERQLIVKRVGSLTAEGAVVLTSDNPVGSDSRQFGAIARTEILGRVTSCSRLKV